jgi:hypothetical protein
VELSLSWIESQGFIPWSYLFCHGQLTRADSFQFDLSFLNEKNQGSVTIKLIVLLKKQNFAIVAEKADLIKAYFD